jgi:hypothetical protein
MRTGDLRRAATELRSAVDASPRDLPAVTALAQLYERSRDQAGRRALLDHTVGLLRHDVERGAVDEPTLRALASVLALRERPHAATAAAQLLVALKSGEAQGARGAPGAGRSLEGLRRPEADDRSFPAGLTPGIRQLMRHVGPLLRPTGGELAQALGRLGLGRADRVARDTSPRPLFAAVAAELHAGDFELYMPSAAGPKPGAAPLRAEPGAPSAIIVGAAIAALGEGALRFAAARTLRLAATGLDVLLAVPPAEAAAIVVAIVRQFVPDYQHPAVSDALVEAESARAARAVPRKLRAQLMPFAVESAGPFDIEALCAAVRDGANAAGLLAAGDLPAALSVLIAAGGAAASATEPLSLAAIVAEPQARALLRFAISDDYDELARAIESG